MQVSILADTAVKQIPEGTWNIDPAWSALEFEVRKIGIVPIHGRVPGFSGTITGGDTPSIFGTADAASVTTFDETRDAHLKSPDFFDVQRHPELHFESTEIVFDGEQVFVAGDLTIKGITRPVQLRGRYLGAGADAYGNERIGLELEGVVDRTAYDLNWNAPLPGGGYLLPNDVALKATIAGIRRD
jgi:polyisoprenoid-binding protein YceI